MRPATGCIANLTFTPRFVNWSNNSCISCCACATAILLEIALTTYAKTSQTTKDSVRFRPRNSLHVAFFRALGHFTNHRPQNTPLLSANSYATARPNRKTLAAGLSCRSAAMV
jgi:hypothetical protein